MNEDQYFYHGLSRRLLFRSVIAAFNCPTSTTSKKSVAYQFSTGSGIIVQLSRSNAFDYHYLDASYLSDYPHEEEQLFFQAQLCFEDIVYHQMSSKYYIQCLRLFQHITKGHYFTHKLKIFRLKHQSTLVAMMDAMRRRAANKDDAESGSGGQRAVSQRERIPEYMQLLFEHYCRSFGAFGGTIWLNPDEFARLEPTVRRYLLPSAMSPDGQPLEEPEEGGNFSSWLQAECGLRIRNADIFRCVVRNEMDFKILDRFWRGRAITLKQITHTVHHHATGESQEIHIRLKLKKGIKNDSSVYLMVKIENRELPQWIRRLRCELGAFCPEIAFSYITAMDISQKMQGIAMCPAVKLEGLDAFEWRIFGKFRAFIDAEHKLYPLY